MTDKLHADAPTDMLTAIGLAMLEHDSMRVLDDFPAEFEDRLRRLNEAFARLEDEHGGR